MPTFLLRLIATAALLALAACGSSGSGFSSAPRTHDETGRAVASPSQAASAFLDICFNAGGSMAAASHVVSRNPNFEREGSSVDGVYFAKHRSLSIDVLVLGDTGCSVSFDTGTEPGKAAADTALHLIPKIGARDIGGRKGSGMVRLTTPKGTVTLVNRRSAGVDGVMVSLMGRR